MMVAFSAIFNKRDNFCDYLLAFLHMKSILKMVILTKERIFFKGEYFFYSKPHFLEGRQSNFGTMAAIESVSIFQLC